MTLVYNIEPAIINIEATKGDTINMSFAIYLNDIAHDMTGNQLDIQVKRKDGLLLKEWSSIGASPNITILTNNFDILDEDGFISSGFYDYDVQELIGTERYTIMKGDFVLKKEVTE